MLTVSELKSLLRTQHVRLTKRLGQHHLIDPRAITRIADACRFSSEDTVVEIGAGLGALTEALAARARRVIAVEVDPAICRLLALRLSSHRNITVQCGDILEFPWADVPGAVVVGAIPYHITSPIVVALAESRAALARIILVIQREVARRLAAKPGTKAYGRLTVLAQYCWKVVERLTIPRSAFFPQPDVDSACVELIPHPRLRVTVLDEAHFFTLVKAAFSQRRKTLVNCVMSEPALRVSHHDAEVLLRRQGLPSDIRGERLSLEQFAALSNMLISANPS